MRYCPNCRRFNPGHPMICHFCGRTWYVRLCPRGHENPPNAQYCGACGSVDLSTPAGRRPIFIIAFKVCLWLILILFVFGFIIGFLNFLNSPKPAAFYSFIISMTLLFIVLWFSISVLPGTARRIVGKVGRTTNRFVFMIVGRIFRGLWELMK